MQSVINKGIVVSFGNTPQAVNDSIAGAVSEDTNGVVILNVMGNDLGGNAKSLYSLDDGVSEGGIRPVDLLVQDQVGVINHSAMGAEIWITAEGMMAYRMTEALKAQVQSMQEGESVVDTTTYAIKLGNGALSWATASVKISGVNDIALITGDSSGTVTEDTTFSAAGVLTVSDADHDQSAAQAAAGSGENGFGTYSVDAGGLWTYNVDNAVIQHLGAGDQAFDSFTVLSLDGTASQVVNITIDGVNDAATFGGDDVGQVTEDGTTGVSGILTTNDVDDGETGFASTGDLNGAHGTWTFDLGTGAWGYGLNNDDAVVQALNTGDSLTETLTVYSLDGTSKDVVVTINGADEPVVVPPPPPPTFTLLPVYPDSPGEDPSDGEATGASSGHTITDNSHDQTLRYGTSGDDHINGNNGVDIIYGGPGNDLINGNNSGDTLYGGSGNDTLQGSGGGDIIVGGLGADTLQGGNGADKFVYNSVEDRGDVINDFLSGTDKIDLSAIGVVWGGQKASPGVDANSVNWYQDGADVIVVVDTDGNTTTAELHMKLVGVASVAQSDFIL